MPWPICELILWEKIKWQIVLARPPLIIVALSRLSRQIYHLSRSRQTIILAKKSVLIVSELNSFCQMTGAFVTRRHTAVFEIVERQKCIWLRVQRGILIKTLSNSGGLFLKSRLITLNCTFNLCELGIYCIFHYIPRLFEWVKKAEK